MGKLTAIVFLAATTLLGSERDWLSTVEPLITQVEKKSYLALRDPSITKSTTGASPTSIRSSDPQSERQESTRIKGVFIFPWGRQPRSRESLHRAFSSRWRSGITIPFPDTSARNCV